MKKKLLSILLVAATLLCFGCGGGSSSASGGNSGGNANNSSDSEQTGDLYGTKKPVSATYSYTKYGTTTGPYPMTFEFNDDGSYVATIEWGITELKYYFSANGNVIKRENYDASKQLTSSAYFVNGTSTQYIVDGYGLDAEPFSYDYLTEFSKTNAQPTYDNAGQISNNDSISCNNTSNAYYSYTDLMIERDDNGRITKTSTTETNIEGYWITYYTNYLYSDNSVIMMSYHSSAYSTSFGKGMKVTYNSHGAVSEIVGVSKDGTSGSSGYTYTYDDYGFLTSMKTSSREYVTIEYTY
jgi:hypothetical protein